VPAPNGSSVVVHSSWRGIVLASLGPVALILIGGLPTIFGQPHPIGLTVLAIGVVLGIVVAFDYPLASRFNESGIERHCMCRRDRRAWPSIDRLTRTADMRSWSSTGRSGFRKPGVPGGLAAVCGKRRILLVNQPESADEFTAVRKVVLEHAPHVSIDAGDPHVGTAPTWLYRRARHRPPV
jgi:hypothetical protein